MKVVYLNSITITHQYSLRISLLQPSIPVQEFNAAAKLPDLVVEGDVMLKEFNFMVDNKIDKPVKIGRVSIEKFYKWKIFYIETCSGCSWVVRIEECRTEWEAAGWGQFEPQQLFSRGWSQHWHLLPRSLLSRHGPHVLGCRIWLDLDERSAATPHRSIIILWKSIVQNTSNLFSQLYKACFAGKCKHYVLAIKNDFAFHVSAKEIKIKLEHSDIIFF